MSVRRQKRRDPKTGAVREFLIVDIVFEHADGKVERIRKVPPVQTKRGAEEYERQLRISLLRPPAEREEKKREDVPTLTQFAPRFIEGHAKANQQKASGIESKRSIIRFHLEPVFGATALDQISDEKVARLRAKLSDRSRKTVNNVLTVLNKLLKIAVRWKVIAQMPCTIELGKVSNVVPIFYEFDEYERLVQAASKMSTTLLVLILLGGDAGLRRGEMMALRWCDVDFRRGQLRIETAQWKRSRRMAERTGVDEWTEDRPKSGRGRIIPMTRALVQALTKHRHLRSERVLCLDDGGGVTGHLMRDWLESVQRRAGFPVKGALHKLRHTFCSHLAMRCAPVKAIQELAGHESLSTTLRYMHLSPGARDAAIELLNRRTG